MRHFNKKRFSTWQVVMMLTIAFVGIIGIAYAVNVPNTFVSDTTISSSQVNQNFTTLGNAMPAVKTVSGTNSSVFTSTTAKNIVSLTVTPPANGYIILNASSTVGINQTTPASNYVSIYLTKTSNGTSSQKTFFCLDTSGGSADRSWAPLSMTKVYSVTGGVATTFYMTAQRDSSGNNSIYVGYYDATLTATYVPDQLP